MLAISPIACSQVVEIDREVFQVTLGTRGESPPKSPVADIIRFIDEAENGDLVVAGYGASQFTDTGSRTKVMIARVDASGAIIWKRIYEELADNDILAFASGANRQYIVLNEYVHDMTGQTPATQTITLRSVNKSGNLSPVIGRLERVNVQGTAAVLDDDLSGFVIAASDSTGITHASRGRRDQSLYAIDLRGEVSQLPFPSGVKSMQHFQYVGDRSFVYMPFDWMINEAPHVDRVNDKGQVTQLIHWQDPIEHLVYNDGRLFADVIVLPPTGIRKVVAFSTGGDELWQHYLGKDQRITALAPLRSGGVIFTTTYENNSLVTSLSPNGEVVWQNRIRSTMQFSDTQRIRELKDNWIAFAGSTALYRGAYASADSDAMLLVTNPDGSGITRYAGCLADPGEIEELRTELKALTGMEVRRDVFMGGGLTADAEVLPVDVRVPVDLDCESVSEHDLREFLQQMVAEVRLLGLSTPSERTKINVHLGAAGSSAPTGFRVIGLAEYGRVPMIAMERGVEGPAARFVADDILPYAEKAQAIVDRLQDIAAMRIDPDRSAFARGGGLSFGNMVETAEGFLVRFGALSASDQSAFVTRFRHQEIVFSEDDDKLFVWHMNQIHVGKNRLDDVFDYVLHELPGVEADIRDEEMAIRDSLAMSLGKHHDLEHTVYLDALRVITASGETLSELDRSKVRETAVHLNIVDAYEFDIHNEAEHGIFGIKSTAADRILEEILDNHEVLMNRLPR